MILKNTFTAVIFTSLLITACVQTDSPGDIWNPSPIAHDQDLKTKINEKITITLTIDDPNNDMILFYIHEKPSHGKLVQIKVNQYRYEPNTDFEGSDNFTYIANDGKSDSNTATISIFVGLPNVAPIARDVNIAIMENEIIEIMLSATDSDGHDGNLIYTIIKSPANGDLDSTSSNKKFTYKPVQDHFGTDSFTFKVNDGLADSGVATVYITIVKQNERPEGLDQTIATNEDTPIENIELTGIDYEDGPLTYRIESPPLNGTLINNETYFTYVPDDNFFGQDQFTFYVNDGVLDSVLPATITIIVDPENDAPLAISKDIVIAKTSDDPLLFFT